MTYKLCIKDGISVMETGSHRTVQAVCYKYGTELMLLIDSEKQRYCIMNANELEKAKFVELKWVKME